MMSKTRFIIVRKPIAKIALIGDAAVGKTSLRKVYLGENLKARYLPTIGADFAVKNLDIGNKPIQFQIWDLAGQPQFHVVRKLYYGGTVGAILIYDVSRPTTFSNLKNWLKELYTHSNKPIMSLAIIGNKIDLRDANENNVTRNEGLEFVEEIKNYYETTSFVFYETSLVENPNVDEIFETLGKAIFG